ncbi:Lrp/AsnC family transcriptional regulator [Nitrospirillum sp. BR 11163]|uniref:Lrp/AsnC family transcriptional regulator n=1 Tax=Nitrospirillum sp. BR 11163 TaxID=3104323 RepID=UPI002AFE8271|nr:Lrp/AsnC family transcriptional regulator [Nitrospirillum sp. BR 11163]MEA1672640.1 Lrp/AsnC family transcriptional regulator [Nitrospirillum sp. BR 11163]
MAIALDRIDRRILLALQENPDISTADLAAKVGLSHTPCWRRLKRLEEDGIIRGRALLLDAKALDLPITVFAEVRLKQHDEDTLEALEQVVRTRTEIVECFCMAGGEGDYLMRIIVSSVESYEHFLKKVLLHLPGVAAVNSRFALSCVKLTTSLPIVA